jgi:hypothetical protein
MHTKFLMSFIPNFSLHIYNILWFCMVPFALIEITPAKLIARDEIYLYYIDAMSSDLTIKQYVYL